MRTNLADDRSYNTGNLSQVDRSGGYGGDEDNETISLQTCAICLEPYVAGDDQVAWSRFQTCRHAFHHKCIKTWLVETKRREGSCPCCRGPYLRGDITVNSEAAHEGDEESSEEDNEMNSTNGAILNESASAPAPVEESHQLCHVIGDGVTTCMGAKFHSFCSVHGLVPKKEHQCNGSFFLSFQSPSSQQLALEEPLLRSWLEQ